MQKFWELFESQDIYGRGIGLHYRGKDSYQTRIGACVSFITYGLIIANLVIRITEFIDKSTQIESVQEIKVNLLEDEPHLFTDNNFDVALASTFPVTKDVGRWRAFRQFKTIDDPVNIQL